MFTYLHVCFSVSPVIWCDNLSTIQLVTNPILHSKMKHVELDFHFVQEKVIVEQFLVNHIPTLEQPADILTKSWSVASLFLFIANWVLWSCHSIWRCWESWWFSADHEWGSNWWSCRQACHHGLDRYWY